MSFLEQVRSTESFFSERIKNKSRSTKANTEKAIIQFDRFCNSKYKKSKDEVFAELNRHDDKKKEKLSYVLLQDFVNYLSDVVNPNTVRTYFTFFKKYFTYITDSKIHSEDIKDNIEFPEIIDEEPYPLTKDQIKEILKHASFERQALYLTLASSGMRIQETCKLRKRNFITTGPRLIVKLPGTYTKNKKPRTVIIGIEAKEYVEKILSKISDDDLVFGTNEDSLKAVGNEQDAFKLVRDKCGFNERYDSGTHKITIHSFRSFFITHAEKIHEGFGHALAGHDRYMKRYERFSTEDLLQAYLKIEPGLAIFNKESESMIELNDRVQELEIQLGERNNRNLQFAKRIRDQAREIGNLDKHSGNLYKTIQALLDRVAELEKKNENQS